MTVFCLAVVARCTWTDQFMTDFQLVTQNIKRMPTICLFYMSEFSTVVSLNNFRLVTKVKNGTFQKVYCRVAALLHVRKDETFSGCFINYCVLIEFLRYRARITGSWDIFNVHLSLNTKL